MTKYNEPGVAYNQPGIVYGGAPPLPPAPSPTTPFVPRITTRIAPDIQISLPFGFDSTGGVLAVDDTAAIDRLNIITLIGTQPGERCMRPTYGVSTRSLLFENDTPALAQLITQEILASALKYAPEIVVTNLDVTPDSITDGQSNIHLTYRPSNARLDTSSDTISTTVAPGG